MTERLIHAKGHPHQCRLARSQKRENGQRLLFENEARRVTCPNCKAEQVRTVLLTDADEVRRPGPQINFAKDVVASILSVTYQHDMRMAKWADIVLGKKS